MIEWKRMIYLLPRIFHYTKNAYLHFILLDMQKFLFFLFIVSSFFLFFEEAFAISEKEGNIILTKHNETRKQLNLSSLQWDKKIALEAQKWADTLSQKDIFRHSESIAR
jgi:Cysteine-rich secretory protein family